MRRSVSIPDSTLPAALRFLSFDGVDGVGKTTQMRLFCDWLRNQGRAVTVCRDPGSTRLGEAIREILLQSTDTPIHRRSEMLLYMAARANLSMRSFSRPWRRARSLSATASCWPMSSTRGTRGGYPWMISGT